jgi:geranylgeranyl diphosphate synthase type I
VSNHGSEQVVARVNARLASFLAHKRAQADLLSPRAAELVDAITALTMRGGKRLRAVAIYAGFRAVTDASASAAMSGVPEGVLQLAAAIELLQSYFLIQDDWMDDDEERRGGPSVHAALAQRHGQAKLGASLAILAADLAVGFAFELLQSTEFPGQRAIQARLTFSEMHFEVVCGQQLDLLGHPDVTLTHHLKTGSYSVRGPLQLGALLGDASAEQLHALERFGRPVGLAFQLRDDLLGTFGDSRATGKPAGHDLREGKNTALVAEAREMLTEASRARLLRVLGQRDASDADIAALTADMERSGVRARVEARLNAHIEEAERALDQSPLSTSGVALLRELLGRIVVRDH